MGLFGKKKDGKKKYRWPPLICSAKDIIDDMKESMLINAPLIMLDVEIFGKPHKVGVISDYDRKKKTFFDAEFYLDDQKFGSLKEFIENASVDGFRFAELDTVAVVYDEVAGNPRFDVLLAERERKV